MWLRADAAEARALNDRTVALDSLSSLIDSVYDELSVNAASIKTRESIVVAAIAGLNSITEIRGEQQVDRTSMLALRRLGGLMEIKGEPRRQNSVLLAPWILRELFYRSNPIRTRQKLIWPQRWSTYPLILFWSNNLKLAWTRCKMKANSCCDLSSPTTQPPRGLAAAGADSCRPARKTAVGAAKPRHHFWIS